MAPKISRKAPKKSAQKPKPSLQPRPIPGPRQQKKKAKLKLLKEGSVAPEFSLPDAAGKMRKLSEFRGKKVILYFYPRDMTPGCTIEACEFRNASREIEKKGAVILGVSPDSPQSHKQFTEKHHLNFPLLSDTRHEVVKAYGVWGEKSFLGHKFEGTHRVTYIIDANGKIAKVFDKVNPLGHAKQVLEAL